VRQREFKVGGRSDEGGAVFPSLPGEGPGSGEGAHLLYFVISQWRVLVNSDLLNLKFFFIVSSISGVRVDSAANFGFSSKARNKTSLNAVNGRR